jgi:integrase/recombinase XerD
VRRFLLEHLVAERSLAHNTQKSYRDTLVLLLPFASAQKRKAIESIAVRDLSADLLKRFLNHLETARSCSIRTRNQRLAAVHALARFIAERSPEHIEWSGQVQEARARRTALSRQAGDGCHFGSSGPQHRARTARSRIDALYV